MWDPISMFFCAWVLNAGMPDARLKVSDVIEANEQRIINDYIKSSAIIREGV